MGNVLVLVILLGLGIAGMLAGVDSTERKADKEFRLRLLRSQTAEVPPYVPSAVAPILRLGRIARRVIAACIAVWLFALARWGWVTVAVTILILAGAGYAAYRWRDVIQRRRKVDKPLALALADILRIRDPRAWRRWLRIPANLDDPDAEVRINLPPRWQGIDQERSAITSLVQRRLPGSWEAKWSYSGFNVTFHHPPPPPEHVIYDPGVSAEQHVIPIGKGSRGVWKTIDLRHTPHVIIAAPTRWGKTVFLTGLASHFAHYGGIVDICDPKRVGFLDAFGPRDGIGLDNVRLHTEIDGMMRAISEFYRDMDATYRAKLDGADITDETQFPSRMLILDEMGSLQEMVKYRWRAMQKELPSKDRESKPVTVSEIMYSLWQGGFARFHVVTGAQQANAEVLISSDARDQYGVKIATGPQSVGSWRMLYGLEPKQGTGRRKGDAIVGVGDSLDRIQLSYIGAEAARNLALAGQRPRLSVEAADAGDMPSSVHGQTESEPPIVGNAAGAKIVGLTPGAFVKARQRAPVEGEWRVGGSPAWTRAALVSWQSRRPRAGRVDIPA
jgi:hypothetical protein